MKLIGDVKEPLQETRKLMSECLKQSEKEEKKIGKGERIRKGMGIVGGQGGRRGDWICLVHIR
jgi:hypothetical protein